MAITKGVVVERSLLLSLRDVLHDTRSLPQVDAAWA
jgi:hypothetical protein